MEPQTPSSAPTRRRLLLWGGLATLAATMAGYFGRSGKPVATETAVAPASAPETATTMPDPEAITVDSAALAADAHPLYTPLLNTEFTIAHPDETTAACKLVAVSPVKTMVTAKGNFTAFSLLFEAKSGFLRDGGICRVSHPDLNAMDLFLCPVGKPEANTTYLEACFTERV